MKKKITTAEDESAIECQRLDDKCHTKTECPQVGDTAVEKPAPVDTAAPVTAQDVPERKPEKTEADLPLSEQEKQSLAAYEKTVNEGESKGLEVALALSEVHRRSLYRETHKSYDLYCEDKWGFQRSHANRLKNAGIAYSALKSLHAKDKSVRLPTSESHLRPFGGMSDEAIQNAWKQVLEKAGKGKITATMVEDVVNATKGKQSNEKPKAPAKIDLKTVKAAFIKLYEAIKKNQIKEAMTFAEECKELLQVDDSPDADNSETTVNAPVEAAAKA